MVTGAAVIALAAVAYVLLMPSGLDRAGREARDYPFVLDVHYSSGFLWDDELLQILVADSTTEEQAATLWCEVITPRGGDVSDTIVETIESRSLGPPVACPTD